MTDVPDLPALVLHAARDIGGVDTAFDAELLLSTLIGSVYSGVLPDRGAAVDSFNHDGWAMLDGCLPAPSAGHDRDGNDLFSFLVGRDGDGTSNDRRRWRRAGRRWR